MIISCADLQEKSNFQSLIQPQYTFGLLIVISLLHASNFVFSEMTTYNLSNNSGDRMWTEGRGLELTDRMLERSSTATEVLKCIHAVLLCVIAVFGSVVVITF